MMPAMSKKPNRQAVRVIRALGGTNAVAKLLEIQPPSVSEWKVSGLPKARLPYFRLVVPHLFPKTRKRATTRG